MPPTCQTANCEAAAVTLVSWDAHVRGLPRLCFPYCERHAAEIEAPDPFPAFRNVRRHPLLLSYAEASGQVPPDDFILVSIDFPDATKERHLLARTDYLVVPGAMMEITGATHYGNGTVQVTLKPKDAPE